jgi:hypothetical protein
MGLRDSRMDRRERSQKRRTWRHYLLAPKEQGADANNSAPKEGLQ